MLLGSFYLKHAFRENLRTFIARVICFARIFGFSIQRYGVCGGRIVSQCSGFTLGHQAAASPWFGSAAHMGPRGIGVSARSENLATWKTGAAFTAGSGGAAVSDGGGCGRACPGPNTCPAVAWSVGSLIGLAGAPREGSGGCGGSARSAWVAGWRVWG